ncbi:dual specificity phosphatase, catalytic domain-containing protein [Phthorimaea operculella]|nr:dual specificity phosphatase, catalytic domain-containing protein [Phthorimaea operculella]
MLTSSLVAAFLHNPAIACIKHWSRKECKHHIDLKTKACYSEIIPGLYLSNARAACDKDILRNLNITHVLTIEAHRLPTSTFENSNITTLFIMAYDNAFTNLLPYFPVTNAFIQEGLKKGNVLVHCHYGVSRSATIVIAYLMEKYKLSYEQAYNFVRSRRRFIHPNCGFVAQLKQYGDLNYDVSHFQRPEVNMYVNARKLKNKFPSVAAVIVAIIAPIAVLIYLKMQEESNRVHFLFSDCNTLLLAGLNEDNIQSLGTYYDGESVCLMDVKFTMMPGSLVSQTKGKNDI